MLLTQNYGCRKDTNAGPAAPITQDFPQCRVSSRVVFGQLNPKGPGRADADSGGQLFAAHQNIRQFVLEYSAGRHQYKVGIILPKPGDREWMPLREFHLPFGSRFEEGFQEDSIDMGLYGRRKLCSNDLRRDIFLREFGKD